MFKDLARRVPRSNEYDERVWQLEVYRRILNGSIYDQMPYSFHEERQSGGDYIPIRDRAPSVRYNLCRLVVEDSVSLLFSEGHFPTIDCEDKAVRDAFISIIKESKLNGVMVDAAIRGSVGSIAILLRVLKNRLFFSVLETGFLTPNWDPEAPDTLLSVTERYKVKGSTLRGNGYPILDSQLDVDHWFQRIWTVDAEEWYVPQGAPVDLDDKPKLDVQRTVQHKLGFVPIVWIKNLPGGNEIDGACTFRGAIDTSIEIDYQLSQAGRGLKYSSDPTLLIKEPAAPGDDIVKGGGNAITVSAEGDAKMLEINGTASAAVIEYVRTLREFALESVHGNRASPERMTAAQSGKALELMNQGLIWLTDNLRVSYGEDGLLKLAKMIVAASQKFPLQVLGMQLPPMAPTAPLSLKWSRWYPSTAQDRLQDANTLAQLSSSGHISRETAVKAIAETYDIEDVPAEIAKINADMATADARAQAMTAQVQAKETLPE